MTLPILPQSRRERRVQVVLQHHVGDDEGCDGGTQPGPASRALHHGGAGEVHVRVDGVPLGRGAPEHEENVVGVRE